MSKYKLPISELEKLGLDTTSSRSHRSSSITSKSTSQHKKTASSGASTSGNIRSSGRASSSGTRQSSRRQTQQQRESATRGQIVEEGNDEDDDDDSGDGSDDNDPHPAGEELDLRERRRIALMATFTRSWQTPAEFRHGQSPTTNEPLDSQALLVRRAYDNLQNSKDIVDGITDRNILSEVIQGMHHRLDNIARQMQRNLHSPQVGRDVAGTARDLFSFQEAIRGLCVDYEDVLDATHRRNLASILIKLLEYVVDKDSDEYAGTMIHRQVQAGDEEGGNLYRKWLHAQHRAQYTYFTLLYTFNDSLSNLPGGTERIRAILNRLYAKSVQSTAGAEDRSIYTLAYRIFESL